MNPIFIVKRNKGERASIMHGADVYLRKNSGKWTIMVESTLNLEIVHLPRRDIAIAEFERITSEMQSGASVIVIEETSPA